MYKLRFTKLPRGVKKHLKINKEWQKFYALNDANILLKNAVFASDAAGEVALTISCGAGEIEYEFRVMIDPDQSLSEQVFEDFGEFLNKKQAEMEVLCHEPDKNRDKIKELEDDILILTNQAKKIRQEFEGFEDDEQSEDGELQEAELLDNIAHNYDEGAFSETELFNDISDETELVDNVFPDISDIEENEDIKSKSEFSVEPELKQESPAPKGINSKPDENKALDYLDVSTIEAIGALEDQVTKIDEHIKKGVDHYIFDELYLTHATDFASKEKKDLIRTKHLSQANQMLINMRDDAQANLDELKRFALGELSTKRDELNSSKASIRKQRMMEVSEMVKYQFDKKKVKLRKEIMEKCDADIARMETELEIEQDQKLIDEVQKIGQALTTGFSANHEKELAECRVEVAKIAEVKASEVIETINQGYENLLIEVKANLDKHEKDIETRYQLHKEDQEDQFAKEISNRELQLRVRQIEIEEKKLLQANETKELSEQVEQLKITLEKNRLEDQMQLLSRDKEDQMKEMRKLKLLVGFSFVFMMVMAGVAFLF